VGGTGCKGLRPKWAAAMSGRLVCVECGATASGNAEGWQADIGDNLRDADPPEVVILLS
jgi:hypothetical protein